LSKAKKGYGAPQEPSNMKALSEFGRVIQERISTLQEKVDLPLFVYYCVFASKVATFSHESCHPAAAKLPPLSSL